MCKLCEIIGDILPRGKTVTDVLLDRMLVVTHRKSDYTSATPLRPVLSNRIKAVALRVLQASQSCSVLMCPVGLKAPESLNC